jgi:protein-S-isoprenylcysteine O-methyltransferase Ste14
MIATATGLALLVPNAVAIAGLAALVVAVQLHNRLLDEPQLRRVHGADYARYAARVGGCAGRRDA